MTAAAPRERRTVVLVDAEHHADAIASALRQLAEEGHHIVTVLYVGGSEKVAQPGEAPDLGFPVSWPDEPERALVELVREHAPDVVVDRTAHPVVDDRRRHAFAASVLAQGVPYEAPGAAYRPIHRPTLVETPSVAVIATGKRTGKTALAGAFARHAAGSGRTPGVVAMGRGGPRAPVVIPPSARPTVDELIEIARRGEHAASDFYEDAVTTGVATIGCRRVGEGPTGEVGYSNVAEGMAALARLDVDLAILEGSGAAVPPAHADATMLIVPAGIDPHDLYAMLPLRFLFADLVVITMADPRLVARDQLAAVTVAVSDIVRSVRRAASEAPPPGTVVTAFRPTPLADIGGRRVFVATTAPAAVGPALRQDLEELGAEVVGITHALSDRPRLREELERAPAHDVLLTELKAAAVDVAAASAAERGIETVFYDNRPVAIERGVELAEDFDALIALADDRQRTRLPFHGRT